MSKQLAPGAFLRAEVLARLRRAGFSDVDVEIQRINRDDGDSNWAVVLTRPLGQDGSAARRLILTEIQPLLRASYNLETD
jgi:hypothetical protein